MEQGFDPRNLEWQRRYLEGDVPWDKGIIAPPLKDYLTKASIRGRILVPGSGRGHDARGLADDPAADVLGWDLSESAVEQARLLHGEAMAGRLHFRSGNFFSLPPELHGAFDWIVEHTCFCAIDPQDRVNYVASAQAALRPQGHLFAIFYLDPGVDSGPPFGVGKSELEELFLPRFHLEEKWVPTSSFPGREDREEVWLLQKA